MGIINQPVFVPPHRRVKINQTTIANLSAITGGEAPTEAEHNLIVTKVNAILTALKDAGVISPT
jgi:hypothetical protein